MAILSLLENGRVFGARARRPAPLLCFKSSISSFGLGSVPGLISSGLRRETSCHCFSCCHWGFAHIWDDNREWVIFLIFSTLSFKMGRWLLHCAKNLIVKWHNGFDATSYEFCSWLYWYVPKFRHQQPSYEMIPLLVKREKNSSRVIFFPLAFYLIASKVCTGENVTRNQELLLRYLWPEVGGRADTSHLLA